MTVTLYVGDRFQYLLLQSVTKLSQTLGFYQHFLFRQFASLAEGTDAYHIFRPAPKVSFLRATVEERVKFRSYSGDQGADSLRSL
jgi:hypothetical protein